MKLSHYDTHKPQYLQPFLRLQPNIPWRKAASDTGRADQGGGVGSSRRGSQGGEVDTWGWREEGKRSSDNAIKEPARCQGEKSFEIVPLTWRVVHLNASLAFLVR